MKNEITPDEYKSVGIKKESETTPRPVKVTVEPDLNRFHGFAKQVLHMGEYDKNETWSEFTDRVALALRQTQFLYDGRDAQ